MEGEATQQSSRTRDGIQRWFLSTMSGPSRGRRRSNARTVYCQTSTAWPMPAVATREPPFMRHAERTALPSPLKLIGESAGKTGWLKLAVESYEARSILLQVMEMISTSRIHWSRAQDAHPSEPSSMSLIQSCVGMVCCSCGGSVEGRYSISTMDSSETPFAAQYAASEDLSSLPSMTKSKGTGVSAGECQPRAAVRREAARACSPCSSTRLMSSDRWKRRHELGTKKLDDGIA